MVSAHNARYYHENRAGVRDKQLARTAAAHRRAGAADDHAARNERYAAAHPERQAARLAVAREVRSGRMLRRPCAICGAKAQAHHDDYSKPLDVMWLCPTHHGERHRLLNRFGPSSQWPADLRVREYPKEINHAS